MRLAQALSVAGRNREAIEQYQQVLKVNKEWVPALSGIGFELMKQKDWKGGEEYFKQVITLTEGKTPEMAGGSSGEIANYYVGIARMEQRDYSGAVGYLKAGAADAPRRVGHLLRAFRLLRQARHRGRSARHASLHPAVRPEHAGGELRLRPAAAQGWRDRRRGRAFPQRRADGAPYKQEPKDELAKLGTALSASRSGQQARFDRRQRGARRGARRGRPRPAVGRVACCSWASSTRNSRSATKASETYQKVLVIDPGNATCDRRTEAGEEWLLRRCRTSSRTPDETSRRAGRATLPARTIRGKLTPRERRRRLILLTVLTLLLAAACATSRTTSR